MNTNIVPSTKLVTVCGSKLDTTRCERYYFWNYVLNLTPKKLKLPLWFGSIMHRAFEALSNPANHKKMNKLIDRFAREESAAFIVDLHDAEEYKLQIRIAKTIIQVYMREFKSELKKMTCLKTEVPFSLMLENSSVYYEGTIDAFGIQKKKPYSVERKTARIINEDFFKLLK